MTLRQFNSNPIGLITLLKNYVIRWVHSNANAVVLYRVQYSLSFVIIALLHTVQRMCDVNKNLICDVNKKILFVM